MAETKAEKKKPGIVRQIFKWIGLGLLALLLIAALIFQAPWKVITLLLIILLACTILPKPLRKWFWLSAAAVIIALIIWVFLPDDNEGWRPYTFDEELAAIEATRSIPDAENTATIYNKLMESYDANDFDAIYSDPNTFDIIYRNPWLSKDYPEVAAWLQRNQSLIETLMEISKTERCIFPIRDPTNLSQQLVDRTTAMRRWAFLLVIAANNDTAEGRIKESLQKNITILQMGNHLCQQPATLDLLANIAVRAIALRQFNRFVISNEPKEAHLNLIEKALAKIKYDWSSDLLRILEYEKLIYRNEFCKCFYEINSNGKIRFSHDPEKTMRVSFKRLLKEDFDKETKTYYKRLANLTYWRKKYMKAGTILSWFYMPPTPQAAAKIIDSRFEEYSKMASADFDWTKEPTENFTPPLLPTPFGFRFRHWIIDSGESYYKIHDLYLRFMADRNGARLLIALRRYKNKNGQWPENLDGIASLVPAETLVDPINNGSFVYKLTEENFTLYSKGKNNIDENGQRTGRKFDLKTKQFVGKEKDDWLIWPPRSRKTKEENTDAEQQ